MFLSAKQTTAGLENLIKAHAERLVQRGVDVDRASDLARKIVTEAYDRDPGIWQALAVWSPTRADNFPSATN